MGCGSICGNSTTATELNLKSAQLLRVLIPKIRANNILLSQSACQRFLKDLQINSFRYILKGRDHIDKNEPVESNIMQKWKIILFGLDSDYQMYVNCLGFSKKNAVPQKPMLNQSEQPQLPHDQTTVQINGQAQSQFKELPHPCFEQIEKDLDRTFQLPNLKRQQFKRVLKRIANHFPKMGYTQGINFIVGYFLIIGYSENDAFWLFVHIALNRKYMLLGLFEDGFPLSTVYICVFKNVLKRHKPRLYKHFYENLVVNDSLWIFKWFITYYLYSFPLEMCKYVWDLVIGQGGIGLIFFAIGIVSHLQQSLLQLNDDCEVSQFFLQLKSLETFNNLVKIDQVLAVAYSVTIKESDLEGINYQTGGFYARYFEAYLKQQLKYGNINPANSMYQIPVQKSEQRMLKVESEQPKGNTGSTDFGADNQKGRKPHKVKKSVSVLFGQCDELLEEWYKGLIRQRKQFVKAKGITHYKNNRIKYSQVSEKNGLLSKNKNKAACGNKNALIQMEQSILIDQSNEIKDLKHKISIEVNIQKLTQQLSTELKQFQKRVNSIDEQVLLQSQQKPTLSHRSSYKKIHQRHHVNANIQIHQIWDQQEQIINQSMDQINDINTIQNFPGIRKVKIDIQNQFSDYQDDHEIKDQFGLSAIRKRSGSKISIKPSEKPKNNFVSNNHVKPGIQYSSDLRNKVKTEVQQFQDVQMHKPQSVIADLNRQGSGEASKKSINKNIKSVDILDMQFTNKYEMNSKKSMKGKSSGSEQSNQNNRKNSNNRLMMAGQSIMSSMSVSNASVSNKSSTSSKNTQRNSIRKEKQNGVNINIKFCSNRYCGCNNKLHMTDQSLNKYNISNQDFGSTFQHPRTINQRKSKCFKQTQLKSKDQCHNVQQYQHQISQLESDRSVDKSLDRSIDMELEQHYQIKMSKASRGQNMYSSKDIELATITNQNQKWINLVKGELANSHGPQAELMINSISKNSGSEVQIIDGKQLFKKKNRVENKIGGGISVVPYDQKSVTNDKRNHISVNKKKHQFTPNYYNPAKANSNDKSNIQNVDHQYSMDGNFAQSNLNRLDHQQSCESIFLPGFSQGKSSVVSGGKNFDNANKNDNFEIESVK